MKAWLGLLLCAVVAAADSSTGLQGVAATIVADPIVSPAPTNDDPLDGTPKLTRSVAGALQTMIDNTAKNKQLTQGLTDLCEAEIDGTKQMLAAGNNVELGERGKDKAALATALGDRVSGLTALMGKLKTIRKKLRLHIIRINEAFTAKNTENKNAMKAASAVKKNERELQLLLLPARETGAEQVTQLFIEVQPEAGADPASSPASEAAEAATVKKLAELADSLYSQVVQNVLTTRADLETERNIMGSFRDQLREMILKREAKLAKLTSQLKALQENIASGGSFAGDILPILNAHWKTITSYKEVLGEGITASEAMQAKIVESVRNGVAPEETETEVVAIAPTVSAPDDTNATSLAAATPAASNEPDQWQDGLADARAVTVTVGFAFRGYSVATYSPSVAKHIISALASKVNIAESKIRIDQVVALPGDPESVKTTVSFSLGGDPPAGVKGKLVLISQDPQQFLTSCRAAGASQLKAVTVTTAPKEVVVKELNV